MDRLGLYELGPNDTVENGIYTGDARVLSESIPDESVDLIFTDPVYQNMDDYRWLAEVAARVLNPNRACLAWAATSLLPSVMAAMTPYLNWAWMLYWQRHGHMAPGRAGITVITTCLWLEKGRAKRRKAIADWYATCNKGPRARQHAWGKPLDLTAKWMNMLAFPEFVVFDPFCGSGVTLAACKVLGLSGLAFEIDPETAELARKRVRLTQPPLFTLEQPEQQPMELAYA